LQALGATLIVGGLALPMLRRRLRVPPGAVLAGAALAPLSAAVIWPRSRGRDIVVCVLQMYVYIAAYKMPHDDPQALEARVRVDYPIALDRAIGLGELPTTRLQRLLHRDGSFSGFEKVLVWAHWVWFATPHVTLLYIRARDPARFPRAAALTYAVFDVGSIAYWLVPTAPPWYAAAQDRLGPCESGETTRVRRLMVEYGESFWQDRWTSLYSLLGGNPLAAMPSLHFATSSMAAVLLCETGGVPGAVGIGYAAVLGFALVYLGEHYVVDLAGGLALCALVRASEPLTARPAARVAAIVGGLRRLALEPGSA
jgi:membrane-associated phospholipid phosphatase